MIAEIILKIYLQILILTVFTIIAKYGYIDKTKFLLDGQIISTKEDNKKNKIVKFEQMNLDLGGILQQQLNNLKFKKPQL